MQSVKMINHQTLWKTTNRVISTLIIKWPYSDSLTGQNTKGRVIRPNECSYSNKWVWVISRDILINKRSLKNITSGLISSLKLSKTKESRKLTESKTSSPIHKRVDSIMRTQEITQKAQRRMSKVRDGVRVRHSQDHWALKESRCQTYLKRSSKSNFNWSYFIIFLNNCRIFENKQKRRKV